MNYVMSCASPDAIGECGCTTGHAQYNNRAYEQGRGQRSQHCPPKCFYRYPRLQSNSSEQLLQFFNSIPYY